MLRSDQTTQVGVSFLSKRSQANPRELLLTLREQNPDASDNRLFELFREQIDGNDDYQLAVDWYFFINMLTYEKRARAATKTHAQVTAQRKRIAGQIAQKILLLNLTMPNGKELGDCFGAEIGKFGSAYLKLEKHVPKTKTVRSVLSENQVRNILLGK